MVVETRRVTNSDDVIDSRDVIERVEQLRVLRLPGELSGDVLNDEDYDTDQDSLFAELAALEDLLLQLAGNGGDEQWEGVWYPVTLVRDSYWEDYARDLAEDIGAVPDDMSWPVYCIDWGRAARELQVDYFSVEFQGVTYWTR